MGRFGRWAGVGVLAVGLAGGAAGLAEDLRPVPPMAPPEPLPAPVAEPTPAPAPKPAAAVALVWTNPAEVRVNRPAPYTLTVSNTGPEPVQQVVVQVRVPAGVTASDAKPPAKSVSGVLLWDLGTLAAGEAKPLAMSFTSPTRGSLTADAWVTCTGSAATTVVVREPKLEAFIEAPATVEIGQTFRVVYRAKNTGDTPLGDVWLDYRPRPEVIAGSYYADADGRRPALRPGDERTQVRLVKAVDPGVLTYELTAASDDGPTTSATATAKVKVLSPKLEVSVTGPAELGIGKSGQYRVKVTNTGDLTAEGVGLGLDTGGGLWIAPESRSPSVWCADNPPAIVAAEWGEAGITIQMKSEGLTIRPGEHREFLVNADATAAGAATVTASAAEKRGIKATAECRTVVRGVPGIRMEVVDSADPLKVGEETTYEVKVQNTGTEADRNLVLACDLPPGMTLVKVDGPVPGLERVGVDFTLDRPVRNRHTVAYDPVRELGPKTEAVFKVTVKAGKAGAAKFTATLTSDHLTTPVVKEESTTVYGE